MVDTSKAGKLSMIYGRVFRYCMKYVSRSENEQALFEEMIKEASDIGYLASGEEYEDFIRHLLIDFMNQKEMQFKADHFVPIDPITFKTMLIEFWSVLTELVNGDKGVFTDLFIRYECSLIVGFAQRYKNIRYACDMALHLSVYLTEKSKAANMQGAVA